ncbi:Pentatricopeptide repeat [Parasponia andersonii]|uniref:Pentatricopeptide repeat n=1 Tax=Parasponia andersonii TaxID=3476 RepID=A0A2P5BH16_PARAD|nr:Pentatricopeptide repeat [Parasponia andersonii]
MVSMASQAATHFSTHTTHLPSLENLPVINLFENCKSMEQLRQIHAQTIKLGIMSLPFVQNKIIALSSALESDNMVYARRVFDEIPEPSVFVWNTMIKGFSRTKCPRDGVSMYAAMLRRSFKPDHYTFPFLFKGFTRDVALACGKELHCHVLKFGFGSNIFVQNALVNMYSLSGLVDMARGVFDSSNERDAVTWNAMISGYNRIKDFDESRKLFKQMVGRGVLPTSVTFVLVLSACSKLKDLDTGKQVHKYIKDREIEPNLVLENALIDMYAACGEMSLSLEVFENMKNRDVISWTTIVSGFANSGQTRLSNQISSIDGCGLHECRFYSATYVEPT